MATLSVLRFTSTGGAEAASHKVRELVERGTLMLLDSGTVRWEAGRRLPEARQIRLAASTSGMGDIFWGMLFGLLYLLPLAAKAAGGPATVRCSLAELGINDDFIRAARERITPGTSALFLLTADATVDRVISTLRAHPFTVISTNLTNRQISALHSVFAQADDEMPVRGDSRCGA